MIRNAVESRQLISGLLPKLIDPLLVTHGFSRKGRSLRYYRQYCEAKQKIEITLSHTRNAALSTVVQVLPVVEFLLPRVNRIALEMVQDPRLLANAPHITLRQQLHIAIPRDHRETWYFIDQDSCSTALKSVGEALSSWGVTFLNEYSSASGIISHYENGDDRIFSHEVWYIFVSAAYIVEDFPDRARKVLETRLAGYWARRRYSSAFKYLDRLHDTKEERQ